MSREAEKRSDDMTVAPERPCPPDRVRPGMSLIDTAELLNQALPGHRVEILGGQLTVTPPPDGAHAESLTTVMGPLLTAGLHAGETRVMQGIGLWLPTGDDDHAIPDLAIVDADYDDHEVRFNCLDPAVFRLVLEVTSSNWRTDLFTKPDLYAAAGVPVYVIGDRKHQEVIVHAEPHNGTYRTRSVYDKDQSFVLPESIGAKVELSAQALLIV